MVIRYDLSKNVLVTTKGHPLDREAFLAIFEDLAAHDPALTYTHVEQPAAAHMLMPEAAAPFPVIVFYDMPGLRFAPESLPSYEEPPAIMRRGFRALLDQGKPMVFLHHAIAGWPAWPAYSEVIGGRFRYRPGRHRDREHLDHGYRHDVTHKIQPTAVNHPLLKGLEHGFSVTDELYLYEVDDDGKQVLLRSDFDFAPTNLYSASHAVQGRMNCNDDWNPPRGSDAIAWVKAVGNSPIAYIQCGDGAHTYTNEAYRTLVGNAIAWALSPEAAIWAKANAQPIPEDL